MSKVGIFYASAGGNTKLIADALKEAYEVEDDDCILMEDDFDSVEQFEDYDVLFLGTSTWGQGDVHFSWVDALFEISSQKIKVGYTYEASLAEMDGKLCGLAIDNINEPSKTQERIENWLEQLKEEI